MKKILCTLVLVLAYTAPAYAEVVLAPQWSEFCPPSFLTVPSTVKTKDKKYWYERRVQFEASVARCNAYRGADLKECYDQVAQAEHNKNRIWDAKVQQNYADLDRLQEINKRHDQYNLVRDVMTIIKK